MSLEGTILGGKYRIETRIARGGMGQIWRARHLTLDVDVAVKVLGGAAVADETMRRRFEREAKSIARLKSPHIVQVLDFGVDQEIPFLVMELLDGEDVGKLVRRRGALPPAEVADLLEQACKALAAAHAAGVVHRDVKPSNLFLAHAGAQSVLKVLDFGIALAGETDGRLTGSEQMLGSPLYMSPEQFSGERIDHRTDLWSLGIVAFELLTGDTPFKGPTPYVIANAIQRGERPRPWANAPSAAALDRFFDRALAIDPSRRFGGAEELAREIHEMSRVVGDGGGIVAPGPASNPGSQGRTPELLSASELPSFAPSGPEPEPALAGVAATRHTARRRRRALLVALLCAGIVAPLAVAGIWMARVRAPESKDAASAPKASAPSAAPSAASAPPAVTPAIAAPAGSTSVAPVESGHASAPTASGSAVASAKSTGPVRRPPPPAPPPPMTIAPPPPPPPPPPAGTPRGSNWVPIF